MTGEKSDMTEKVRHYSMVFAGISLYLPPQKNKNMNFEGIIVGLATFFIIGIFHPIVIKAEYHIGKKCWWAFLLAGIGFAVLSLFIDSLVWSTITGVTAFSCFWSIHELFEQEKRVQKGWFPKKDR